MLYMYFQAVATMKDRYPDRKIDNWEVDLDNIEVAELIHRNSYM